jgi:hypothetical protein
VRLIHTDGEAYVEPGQWSAWVDSLQPLKVTAAEFAADHGVPVDDVVALVRAGALDGTSSKLTGVLVKKHQPLIDPAHLVPLDEACAAALTLLWTVWCRQRIALVFSSPMASRFVHVSMF